MISLDDLSFHGRGLSRPECVLSHQSGLLFASCWYGSGGVSVISPSGKTSHILAQSVSSPLRPNGIALEAGGSFLLAHLGEEYGAVIRLFHDGRTELLTDSIAGQRLPPVNFVTLDRDGNIWITISSRVTPRARDYRSSASTGFIAVHTNGQTRVAADSLGYTNELTFSADNCRLFVNETFARRTTSFDISNGLTLKNKTTAAEYGVGTFPDGLTIDQEGALWVTSIISNRVIRVTGGTSKVMLEDCDTEHLATVEKAFKADALGRPHLDRAVSEKLMNISSLAFDSTGGRAYLGCLSGDRIVSFETGTAGTRQHHWDADLGPLERYLEPI